MPKVVPEYKEDAKRKIIQAAVDLFTEQGITQTSIDQVAKRLGVSKGAVYWYFPNKDALVREVLQTILEDFRRIAFDSYYNKPVEELLRELFERFVLSDEKKRALFYEMVTMASRDYTNRSATRACMKEFITAITEVVSQKQNQKKIPDRIDPEMLATIFLSQLVGFQLLNMLWIPRTQLRDLWDRSLDIILQKDIPSPSSKDRQ